MEAVECFDKIDARAHRVFAVADRRYNRRDRVALGHIERDLGLLPGIAVFDEGGDISVNGVAAADCEEEAKRNNCSPRWDVRIIVQTNAS